MKKFILFLLTFILLSSIAYAGVFGSDAYYKLEDLTEEGGGNSLTGNGDPTFVGGILNDGVMLDQSGDFLSVTADTSFSTSFTINGWLNATNVAAGGYVLSYNTADWTDSIRWDTSPGGVPGGGFRVEMRNGTTTPFHDIRDTSSSISINTWIMLTLIADGTNVVLYRDSIAVANASDSTDWGATFGDTEINFGADVADDSLLFGMLDDWSISPIARDQAWIDARWNGGAGAELVAGVDEIAPTWNGNNTNATATTDKGQIVQFNINWTDETELSFIKFGWNSSGIWENISNISARGLTNLNYSVNHTITSDNDKLYFRFFANDSSNNWNQTDIFFINLSVNSITFDSQKPSNIDIFNLFNFDLNITYETTGKLNNVSIFYEINDSQGTNPFYVNGTFIKQGLIQKNSTRINSTSFSLILDESDIYPATYNFDQENMEDEVKRTINMTIGTNYVMVSFLNVSKDKNFSFFEIYLQNMSGNSNPSQILYCNSTYTAGNPQTSDYCTVFETLTADVTLNHTHGVNSWHHVIPFSMDSDGIIGGVQVTPLSRFLIRGAANGWSINYIENKTRDFALALSTNNGIDFSNIEGTADAHLHQYGFNESLYYIGQGCEGTINCINDSFIVDPINEVGLHPTSPDVFSPGEGNFSGSIQINYTTAFAFNGAVVSQYNITLIDWNTLAFQYHISVIEADGRGYLWDNANVSDGTYRIEVEACDNNGLCSMGFSEIFVFDRIDPDSSMIEPVNNKIYTNDSAIFSMTCNDSNLFGFDFSIRNETDVVFSNRTRDINASFIHFNNTMDFTLLPDSLYNAQFDCLDGHTARLMDEIDNRKGSDWLKIGDFIINVDAPQKIDYKKLYDRYSFDIEYAAKGLKTMTVTSPNKIYIRKDSEYSGHLITGGYWLDTEPYTPKSITRINDREVIITLDGDKFNFNSIGILNNDSVNSDFSISRAIDNITNVSPVNNTKINGTNPKQTFIYDVFIEPATVINCSIIINDSIADSTTAINPKGQNTFTEINFRMLGTGNHTYKYNCFTSLINNSATEISQVNSSLFNINVLVFVGEEITGELSITDCPTTTAGIGSLLLITTVAIVFIILGLVFKIGFIGFFGSIMMMVTSWYISPCQAFFAFIMALFSFVLLIWFVFMTPNNS